MDRKQIQVRTDRDEQNLPQSFKLTIVIDEKWSGPPISPPVRRAVNLYYCRFFFNNLLLCQPLVPLRAKRDVSKR